MDALIVGQDRVLKTGLTLKQTLVVHVVGMDHHERQGLPCALKQSQNVADGSLQHFHQKGGVALEGALLGLEVEEAAVRAKPTARGTGSALLLKLSTFVI